MPSFPFGKTLKVTGSKVKSIKVLPIGKIQVVVGDSPKRNPKKKRPLSWRLLVHSQR